MAIISVEQIKQKLKWDNIHLKHRKEEYNGNSYEYADVIIFPDTENLPTIEFVFDSEISYIECVGFSNWHTHYDSYEDDRRNLVKVLQDTKKLINHKSCLVEELQRDGKYSGGSILTPDGLPSSLTKDVKTLRRFFFNQEPKDEEIDFSRYIKVKELYVLKEVYKEAKEVYRQAGIEYPF